MKADPTNEYARRAERMVHPDEVAIISLFGSLLGKLPAGVQARIQESSSRKNPYMGFVVEPYALFLCHEITDVERAEALLPRGYRIVPTRIFEDDEPRPTVIFGAFTVHTSAFWGSRVEMYVIAEHEDSGMMSWVIVDYDSDTLSYDPGQGFVDGGARGAVVTTTHRGEVVVDVPRAQPARRIAAVADVRAGVETPLDQRLWLEGNLSVSYGGHLDDGRGVPFGLVFEPGEMERALRIPLDAVTLEELSWHEGLFAPEPSVVACFPYAQHFVTGQIPTESDIRSREDLEAAVAAFNAAPPSEGFSSAAIKRSMAIGMAISALTTTSLLLWIVLHYLLKH